MLFTSSEFLLVFFPVVLIINFISPRKIKNLWLLLASLFFYAWGEPDYVLIMLFSIVLTISWRYLLDGRTQSIFDVEFCNKNHDSVKWTFKVPKEKSEYALLIYAGISGKTKNTGVDCSGINVSLFEAG